MFTNRREGEDYYSLPSTDGATVFTQKINNTHPCDSTASVFVCLLCFHRGVSNRARANFFLKTLPLQCLLINARDLGTKQSKNHQNAVNL